MILDSTNLPFESKESELRCRLFARCGSNFIHYKHLAEWLGVYQYILPDQRVFTPVRILITSAHHAFLVWKFVDLMSVCLTATEQELVWQLINESKTSAIPAF